MVTAVTTIAARTIKPAHIFSRESIQTLRQFSVACIVTQAPPWILAYS